MRVIAIQDQAPPADDEWSFSPKMKKHVVDAAGLGQSVYIEEWPCHA